MPIHGKDLLSRCIMQVGGVDLAIALSCMDVAPAIVHNSGLGSVNDRL